MMIKFRQLVRPTVLPGLPSLASDSKAGLRQAPILCQWVATYGMQIQILSRAPFLVEFRDLSEDLVALVYNVLAVHTPGTRVCR